MANRLNVSVRLPINWPRLRHVFLVVALLVSASCAGLFQRIYSAEAIEAWVVDKKTGKPLEGVIVVAHWKLMRGTVGGRVPAGTMMLLETVTDVNGRFSFPAWGPLETASEGFLDHEDPLLILFAPGHRRLVLRNHWETKADDKPSKRKSQWSGKTIKLAPFEGPIKEYADDVADQSRYTASELDWYNDLYTNCNIDKTPFLAEAFDRENRAMEARGLRRGGFVLDRFSPERLRKCRFDARGSDGR